MHTIDNSSEGADGVRLGDINGDGLPDIATGWEEGGLVRVYVNPGLEQVGKPWPAVTVGTVADVEDAVFADVDGDGRPEVVSSCEGETRCMYVHSLATGGSLLETSAWRTEPIGQSSGMMQWMFSASVELDSSGRVSLIAAGKLEQAAIGLFERGGSLEEWTWTPLAAAGWVMSIRALDMDGDGDTDILFSDRYGSLRGVRWLENQGGGKWLDHLIGGRDYEILFLDIADLDGDGESEIAAAAKPDRILIFDRTDAGWSLNEVPYPDSTGRAKAVAVADFDLDGRPDIAASCEGATGCSGVFWLRADNWLDPVKVEYFDIAGERGIKFDRIECIDLDGDGDLDVLTTDERDSLGVIWYENPIR